MIILAMLLSTLDTSTSFSGGAEGRGNFVYFPFIYQTNRQQIFTILTTMCIIIVSCSSAR